MAAVEVVLGLVLEGESSAYVALPMKTLHNVSPPPSLLGPLQGLDLGEMRESLCCLMARMDSSSGGVFTSSMAYASTLASAFCASTFSSKFQGSKFWFRYRFWSLHIQKRIEVSVDTYWKPWKKNLGKLWILFYFFYFLKLQDMIKS